MAFYRCTSLAGATLGTRVASIGGGAFGYCTSLTSAAIPNAVTNIGIGAFSNCTSLAEISVAALNADYSSLAGVLFNKNQTTLIEYPAAKAAGDYSIPSSVTSISDYAFASCTRLTNLTIPDSVTNIGRAAFVFCTSLANIAIPNSVSSLRDQTFLACTSLTNVTIPNSVSGLGFIAFAHCTSLTSIIIPDSVTNLGMRTFEYCTDLTSVTIPESVTSIGYGVFGSCANLTNIMIPGSVTNISDNAFSDCPSLTGVYLKGDALEISSQAFNGASNVTLYCLAGTTHSGLTYAGRPAVPWKPWAQTSDTCFGVRTNQFGFNIAWPAVRSSWWRSARIWRIPPGFRWTTEWKQNFISLSKQSQSLIWGKCFVLCLIAEQVTPEVTQAIRGDKFGLFGVVRIKGGGGNVFIADLQGKQVYGKVPALPLDVRKFSKQAQEMLQGLVALPAAATHK